MDDMRQLAIGFVNGQMVAKDSEGVPWCFLLMLCKADEETRSVVWGFRSYSSAQPCSECEANKTNMPFTDLTREAQWRPTETPKPLVTYLANVQGDHPLIRSPFASRCLA